MAVNYRTNVLKFMSYEFLGVRKEIVQYAATVAGCVTANSKTNYRMPINVHDLPF
jgi:hypothetical protein